MAECADTCFGARSEAAITAPQTRRLAVGCTFKFAFNSKIAMAIDTLLQRMWFSAL